MELIMTRRLFYSCSWLLLVTTPALAIDCGCPKTCTAEALKEKNGAPWTCGDRIAWTMKHHDDPEANACAVVSKDPSLNATQNENRPCRFEACNPNGGCKSKLIVDPNAHPPITCGCDSCNSEELAKVQGPNDFSCESRIEYYMHRWHLLEWDACAAASNETSCNLTACDPVMCGSNLSRVAKDHINHSASSPIGFGFGLFLVLLMVLPATLVVYKQRRKQAAAAAQLKNPRDDDLTTDGLYRDKPTDDNDEENDGVELSSYKDEPINVKQRPALHVPPANVFHMEPTEESNELT
jgi:hypothetical protein